MGTNGNGDMDIALKEELESIERKAQVGKCTVEEHRRILVCRHLLEKIPSDLYWLNEV